ncbi:methyltransferase, FxLD system [Polymorphospora sp. NPDC050346]|uniref:methyltransferase, FxLD system n=1 Tax=Polymorphospora sp. NPDC050346 TaxID=3155780 RepID=UPI0033E37FDD
MPADHLTRRRPGGGTIDHAEVRMLLGPDDWPQVAVEFADRDSIERVAVAYLAPALAGAQSAGVIGPWWWVRKGLRWRVRWRPTATNGVAHLVGVLDGLAARGVIAGWAVGIYEPETAVFGGSQAMEVAHDLWVADSRHVLDELARLPDGRLGRREVGVLLATVLTRGAGQDWYEQGDIWARLAEHRPHVNPAGRSTAAIRRLMTVDVSATSALLDGGPLAPYAGWIGAYDHAGRRLAALADDGHLRRGLRAVLAHHLLFAWNRLGLPAETQAVLSTLAREVVMSDTSHHAPPGAPVAGRSAVGATAAPATNPGSDTALRHALVDQLLANGTVRTPRVEAALRAVPRHLFLPGTPMAAAYADTPVYTKQAGDGTQISAASQPTIVAMMLEQLQVEPGDKILELGAGTGYNAGLLAHLAGPTGKVTTIDVDDDIVEGARTGLAAAGIGNVDVVCGDGALGHAGGAPYNRVIATVGAFDLPPAWLAQLAPGGRLVVPLRLRGSTARSIAFDIDGGGRLQSRTSELCSFMPLRGGIGDDPRRMVQLTADGAVRLQTHQDQTVDDEALAGVLESEGVEEWTGVRFAGPESQEWMDLWLACVLPQALTRMLVDPAAAGGRVRPQFGWGSMATWDKGDLAYLTLRTGSENGARRYEVGVIGHGPGGDVLAHRVADAIRAWDREHRGGTVTFEVQPADTAPTGPVPGRFVFSGRHHQLVICWQ